MYPQQTWRPGPWLESRALNHNGSGSRERSASPVAAPAPSSRVAGPTPHGPSLVRLRPAARPLAERSHTPSPPTHTPLGQMGAVGADLRGSLEKDQACEEGAGVRAGTRDWGTARPRGTERRRPGTGVPGLWDGDGEPEPGLKDPGMETQVWGWVVEIGEGAWGVRE